MNNKILLFVSGIVILGIIAFVFLSKQSQNLSNQGLAPTGLMQTIQTIPIYSQTSPDKLGSADIKEQNGNVIVLATISGQTPDSDLSANFHEGACPTLGEVKYSLSSVKGGKSETVLSISAAEFVKQLPLALNIRKAPNGAIANVACGDVRPLIPPAASESASQ